MHRIASIPARRPLFATTALVFSLLLAATAFAQDAKKPVAQPNAGPAPQVSAATPERSGAASGEASAQPVAPGVGATAAKPTLSPVVAAMMVVLDQQDVKLKQLADRLQKAGTNDEALDLQRQIQQVKLDTEVALLRVQADFARRDGRAADADRLDAAIHDLTTPPKPGVPVNRPVPVRDAQH